MFVSLEQKLDVIKKITGTILLVEDNESLANAIAGLLRICGYEVLQARNGAEAFRLSVSYNDRIHLLFSDVVLPQVNGIDLAGLLLVQRPDMQVLFMSGYTEEELRKAGLLAPGFSFVQKPASIHNILTRIQTLLSSETPAITREH